MYFTFQNPEMFLQALARLEKFRKRSGGIYSMWIGMMPSLIVCDAKHMEVILFIYYFIIIIIIFIFVTFINQIKLQHLQVIEWSSTKLQNRLPKMRMISE